MSSHQYHFSGHKDWQWKNVTRPSQDYERVWPGNKIMKMSAVVPPACWWKFCRLTLWPWPSTLTDDLDLQFKHCRERFMRPIMTYMDMMCLLVVVLATNRTLDVFHFSHWETKKISTPDKGYFTAILNVCIWRKTLSGSFFIKLLRAAGWVSTGKKFLTLIFIGK